MNQNSNKTDRRTFLSKTGMAAAGLTLGARQVSAKSYSRILGSNEKIRVGFIGVGNRGTQVMHEFMKTRLKAALCDVYEPYLLRDQSADPRYIADRPLIPKWERIFPKMSVFIKITETWRTRPLMQFIGTPDHWHPLQAIDSMNAGKDIFVEKP